jgi:arginyl-tRNA synthetase
LVWTELTDAIAAALRDLGLEAPERLARLELAIPREPSHGDWTTNLALVLAKDLKRNPRELAQALAQRLSGDARVGPAEVAGPGFLNFRYRDAFLDALPRAIVDAGPEFGGSRLGTPERIQVEYVSANPTGPLNVVSARAAAVGAALVRLFRATGHDAHGEFYVNDAGNQADLLGASVAARWAEVHGLPGAAIPEQGYVGEYVKELARSLPEAEASRAFHGDGGAWFRAEALERMLAWQKRDLDHYGAEFSNWFKESTLHPGKVDETLAALRARGVVYEAEGATWLRTTSFGDDKDRVIVRSNGAPTYLLPDIAYHRDKHDRGFRRAIDLWGPDHHGHILPMRASLEALGLESDFLEVLIVQQVNLLSGGQPVKMSKRAGEFISLRDLMDDVGADSAKFFFLMRSTSAHLDFDLDLARQQNDENPSFYVQYAHARIASVLRYAAERGLEPSARGETYAAPEERTLARQLAAFPEVVRGAAAAREPHRIPTYLVETAAAFHRFYHACRVVSDDATRSRDRLLLVDACRVVIRNGLALLGVSAPERMERAAEVEA